MKKYLSNFKYEVGVFVVFVLLRLPYLGHDIFNTDVWKWKSRIFNFSNGIFNLDFVQTLQRYHPGVTLMWLGTIGVKLNSFYYKVLLGITPPDNDITTVFTLHFFQKLVIVMFLALATSGIFFALKKIISIKFALVFSFILLLEPFYLALTRVIHLEGLLSTLMLGSFVWGYYYVSISKTKKTLIVFALYTTLAILTKTSALMLLPFIGLMFFLYTKNLKESVKNYLFWLLFVVFFMLLLWPALWVNPVLVFQTLYRGVFDTGIEEGHIQLYFGNLVENPGLTFYPVVLLARSSLYIVVGALGYLVYAKRNIDEKRKRFAFYTFLYAATYFIEMSIPSKKLDRYILPSLISLILISAMFFEYALIKFKKSILLVLFIFPALITYFYLNFDYLSYYSPLVGGLKNGIYIIEPKWSIGQKQIQAYFKDVLASGEYATFTKDESLDALINTSILSTKLVVGFPEKYYTQFHPFIRQIGGWATIKDITAQAKYTAYFVYPVWEDDSDKEDRFKIDYVGSIYERNIKLYNVYKRVDD